MADRGHTVTAPKRRAKAPARPPWADRGRAHRAGVDAHMALTEQIAQAARARAFPRGTPRLPALRRDTQ